MSPPLPLESTTLEQLAADIAGRLAASGERLVLAESCTAGLVANLLCQTPGASRWFCGSAVVYQEATKAAWLDVPESILDDPAIGAVSEETALAMCHGGLHRTPHASIAAAVTGHLGPNAPASLDGMVWIAVASRDWTITRQVRLTEVLPGEQSGGTLRSYRQQLAAVEVLRTLAEFLTQLARAT
ncbi:MAG: CinA family protein [Planctomycetaceae bacterium]